ncbi:Gfo/Idh/MocA family protein [Celerinatantimonas diazotrophica]|uniref:Putative dehydrogenase n=1 Tax=Celerinatantimonas diazotrophica TaxID=412034 RepID=A0A4R1K4E9_9GAMM|nr:Gfo/Idh/MocA family oxidoreductase [Celerinatantimonas diazotrophica]TCK58603.1 putative dehydrogenase [Celerinatantimonas diazotrophica]CAG9297232.1 scyllo-inositol 2-dehydrogenase (NADP(+)) IolU [Celerinatantimonas diazotrophica]
MSDQHVRWAIAGLGNIAHRFVKDLLKHVPNARLEAVAARQLSRAKQFAQIYQSPKYYGSYQQLAQDPDVDAVYIASIHPQHRVMAKIFLNHGKHVLVEKPAFTTVADWDAMAALAQSQKRLLVEAMKSVTFPAYRQFKEFIKLNQITLDSIEASFGNANPFDAQSRLFDPQLCGGATLDVGVYPLWLYADLCALMGISLPEPVVTHVQSNPKVRVDATVEYRFSGAIRGLLGASISTDLPRQARIKGPDFTATIHDKWWNPKTIDMIYRGQNYQIVTPERGGGFEYEIEHISSLILAGQEQSDLLPGATTRKVINSMQQALTSIGLQSLLQVN